MTIGFDKPPTLGHSVIGVPSKRNFVVGNGN
jgi:hypothetical protein